MTSMADVASVISVLLLYSNLPDTPLRASRYDENVARCWLQRGVALDLIESALLLGSLRRRIRPSGSLPLPRIRALAYFSPLVEELLQQPLPAAYQDYLRRKARQVLHLDVLTPATPQHGSSR
jgi:hypothetical protein